MIRATSLFALLLIAGAAHAQSTSGLCSGLMTGTASLAVADGAGTWHELARSEVPQFFGGAECACDTQDVGLAIDLNTALPASQTGVAEIWVGDSSCADVATRTSASNTTCKKVATPSLQDFTINGAARLRYPLSSRTLFNLSANDCGDVPLAGNSVWVFIFTDPNQPLATCTLSLTESNAKPPAPSGVAASWLPDGSVSLSWTAPTGAPAPVGYDILCAADDGTAEGSRDFADFSLCTSGGIVRRALVADGGPLVGSGPATAGSALDPPSPDAVCAHAAATATGMTLHGLPTATAHRFAVVAIDAFGNAGASTAARLDAAPPAPPAPMGHSGCSVAGRGSVAPWLAIAIALLAFASIRRRSSR
jgi:MYXO-CTERM domain-containing protein